MRRRLQFSLLGFLLMVAAIAAGTWFWFIPHRSIERYDQGPLALRLNYPMFMDKVIEYEYVHSLSGRSYRPVVMRFEPREVGIFSESAAGGSNTYLIDLARAQSAVPFPGNEFVSCILYEYEAVPIPVTTQTGTQQRTMTFRNPILYCVSNQGHVYTLNCVYLAPLALRQTEQQIPVGELGRAIREERNKILQATPIQ
ncbi:MAG: hypothetical protein QM811_01965 [Pirellulales bacterium]